MTFIWRNRNNGIVDISPGFGFGLSVSTIAGQNPAKFNLLDHKYMDTWITKDFKLGKLHVLSRVKSFAIFLQNLVSETDIAISHRPNLPRLHYKLNWKNRKTIKEIEYEQFDYNIIKSDINPFADTLVNEMFVLFRMLWRTRGAYDIEVIFDEDLDMKEFGDRNAGPFWAKQKFEIDEQGLWQAHFTFKFKQPESLIDPPDPLTPRRPFFAQDYSRVETNNAKRARKLAKPSWGDEGRSHEEFHALLEEEKFLNSTVDLSFEYEWQGQGDWSNPERFRVEPSKGKIKKITPIIPIT